MGEKISGVIATLPPFKAFPQSNRQSMHSSFKFNEPVSDKALISHTHTHRQALFDFDIYTPLMLCKVDRYCF